MDVQLQLVQSKRNDTAALVRIKNSKEEKKEKKHEIERTSLVYTWECPASLDVFEEVIVVGYWGCCRRLCPVGIDLAIPVAI